MKIQFLGAAQTVTGSCYMIEANGHRFAVDCGLHQGNQEIEKRNKNMEPYDPARIDFFLITHAHMDHTGLLPRMIRDGFRGDIFVTPPTRDLLEIMLLDSAHIQEMEAEWQNRKHSRKGRKLVDPLYTQADAQEAHKFFRPVEYDTSFEPAPGVRVCYRDAGHILGSAFLEIVIEEEGETYRMIFSGDLGRPNQLIVNDPENPEPADYLFLESTYGNRNHKDEQSSRQELAEAIEYSYKRGEKVIIPAFAVERTQEVLYCLHLIHKDGKLPADMPVYVDSPLAIKATEIFRKHSKYFDDEAQALIAKGEDPLSLPNLKFTQTRDESQAINTTAGPAVVISASGMCNAGRVKHHLRHNIWRDGASIVFVGFQGKGTPGRRIVDGAQTIRLFNEDLAIRAKVFTIGGFSGHAGQSQILKWLEAFSKKDMKVFLVHGEETAQQTLAGLIRSRFGVKVHIPAYLEECVLKPGAAHEIVAVPELAAEPGVDWDYVLGEVEGKLTQLRDRVQSEGVNWEWEYQTDLRDRILEINTDLIGVISELSSANNKRSAQRTDAQDR